MDNWTNKGLQITHLRYASDGEDESYESYGKDDRMSPFTASKVDLSTFSKLTYISISKAQFFF